MARKLAVARLSPQAMWFRKVSWCLRAVYSWAIQENCAARLRPKIKRASRPTPRATSSTRKRIRRRRHRRRLASGAKAPRCSPGDVAAEAATHKDSRTIALRDYADDL